MRGRVIGVGNPDRADDGLGIVAARRLRACCPNDVSVVEQTGEPAALIEAWRDADRVLLIDAAHGAAAPGTVHRFDASAAALPVTLSSSSSHSLGVAEAIELSRALGSLPPRLAVYCVEAESIEPGAPLSASVEAALPGLLARVLAEISAATD